MNGRLAVTTGFGLLVALLAGFWVWRGSALTVAEGGAIDEPAPVAPRAGESDGPFIATERAARPTPPVFAPAPDADLASAATAPDGAAAVERYLAEHSRDELRLLATLARKNLDAPPELEPLFALRRQGASPAELLRAMHRTFAFPRGRDGASLRLAVTAWIESLSVGSGHPAKASLKLPGGGPRRAQGVIEPQAGQAVR